jgi:hypothetical protein
MIPRTVTALAGSSLLILALAGCTAATPTPEPTPEPIAAEESCAQFDDVQTILVNAQGARRDERMEEQEYQGWLRLAARALSRIDVQPGTDVATALQHAQDAAPAVKLGAVASSGINESTAWFEAVDEVRLACEASGVELAVERFVGG